MKNVMFRISIIFMVFAGVFSSCTKMEKIDSKLIDESDERWLGKMILKQIEDVNEDPEIIAILQKHDVELYRTYPGDEVNELLMCYYTLIGKGIKSKENSVRDLFATGKFYGSFDEKWSGEMKLKLQGVSYSATNDPEIIDIIKKYDLEMYQSYWGAKTPELLLYYTLRGERLYNKENSVRDLNATGKFEEWFQDGGIAFGL